jgi:hypothetical protein
LPEWQRGVGQLMTHADVIKTLEVLRFRLVETASGYLEGAELAEREEVQDIFFRLGGLHLRHATAMGGMLTERGGQPDAPPPPARIEAEILRVRTLVTGFERNLMRGLLNREERIALLYDEMADLMRGDLPLWSTLVTQRADLMREIATLRARAAAPDRNNPD